MVHPLSHPEAQRLYKELLSSLAEESDRGALLVGLAHVDNCLESLLRAVFPADLSGKQRKQLLAYPGPLSALASRVNVAYALRLIPRSVYEATNILRAIRNDVAHRPEAFSLKENQERITTAYEALGPTLRGGLRQVTLEIFVEYKISVILDAAKGADVGIETREAALAFIRDHEDLIANFEGQVLHWESAIGIALH